MSIMDYLTGPMSEEELLVEDSRQDFPPQLLILKSPDKRIVIIKQTLPPPEPITAKLMACFKSEEEVQKFLRKEVDKLIRKDFVSISVTFNEAIEIAKQKSKDGVKGIKLIYAEAIYWTN